MAVLLQELLGFGFREELALRTAETAAGVLVAGLVAVGALVLPEPWSRGATGHSPLEDAVVLLGVHIDWSFGGTAGRQLQFVGRLRRVAGLWRTQRLYKLRLHHVSGVRREAEDRYEGWH